MSPAAAHKPAFFSLLIVFFSLIDFPPKQNAWCEPADTAASQQRPFLFLLRLFFPDSYNLNITESTCQKGRGRGSGRAAGKHKNELTQIYKNMPLELYQQLRIVGALFTEQKAICQYLQQYRRLSHTGTRRLQVAERYSDNRRRWTLKSTGSDLFCAFCKCAWEGERVEGNSS